MNQETPINTLDSATARRLTINDGKTIMPPSFGGAGGIVLGSPVPASDNLAKYMAENKPEPAPGFLTEAAEAMAARAQLRDKPQGERSMECIVKTFNALTGHTLSEAEGWEFMVLLKMVRGRQGKYNRDDYVDLAAYGGLLGECESARVR